MNFIFLSPAFPPTAPAFCAALAARGVTVLGIGDEPLSTDQARAHGLSHYIFEPRMAEPHMLHAVVEALIARFGPVQRVDSNGEHWLAAEARLRDDLGIPGLGSEAVQQQRSKLGMASLFARADIGSPPGVLAADEAAVRRLAETHGYPLVFKPDSGSGAVDTFRVDTEAELAIALARDLRAHVAQPFVPGDIITFDGLADRDGKIVFFTSHVYDRGIMQVRQGALDGYYYSLRELPVGLEDVGRRAVAAFDVRERFFHVEFFKHDDGSYTALEMNLRPPGGFTTDMMSAACGLDVYGLWAAAATGEAVGEQPFERRYHTAHAGRRSTKVYRLEREELLLALGDALLAERAVPPAFAATMGDTAYLLRHEHLPSLLDAIGLVQAGKIP